jgi:hypothetical protein
MGSLHLLKPANAEALAEAMSAENLSHTHAETLDFVVQEMRSLTTPWRVIRRTRAQPRKRAPAPVLLSRRS